MVQSKPSPVRSFPAFTFFVVTSATSVVAQAVLASPVHAADEQRRAEELFAKSETLYQAGDFRGAIALLEEANRLSPHPVLVYNLARAHESLGENDQAVTYYRRYLELDPNAADKGAVAKRIDTLVRAQEKPKVEPPSGKDPPPDGTTVVTSPSPVPWIVAGVGVLGVGAGAVLGGLALSKHADAEVPTLDGAETERLAASADDLALGASIAFVAGGVVAAAGIVWGIVDVATSGAPAQVSVGVSPTGVVVRGAF